MKRCPKCMTVTDSRFCPECGNDMSTVKSLICPQCGNETASRFCPNCGTKMPDPSEPVGMKDGEETPVKENDVITLADKENSDSPKKKPDANTKKLIAAGAGILLLIIVLIAAFSPDKKTSDTSAEVSTDTYNAVDDSSQAYDSVDDSNYSGSTTSSTADDGMDRIQGSWRIVGIVTDGESSNVSGLSVGGLEISGDRWTLTISTDETTVNSGTLYFDMKSDLDSGEPFYIYTLKSEGMSGSVKMAYSAEDNFIAVSTKPTLDPDNCMMFAK